MGRRKASFWRMLIREIPIINKDIYMIITSLLISGIGIGMSLPSLDALITEGIEKEQRGTITSLYSSLRFVGVAAGPPTFAYLMNKPDNYMLYFSIFLAVVGLILSIKYIKPKQETQAVKSN